VLVFRLGSFIPIPGINSVALSALFNQQKGTIIEMFNMFSGGALSRASIFALGIMPYISSSIIIQLLTVVHSPLAELKKEGEAGRRKINQYTRYGTLVLGTFQAIGISTGLPAFTLTRLFSCFTNCFWQSSNNTDKYNNRNTITDSTFSYLFT
jgi:preprotein translocase subunit SecY